MPEVFSVNGVDLTTLAHKIEDISGVGIAPGRRGDNLKVPRRNGVVRVPRKLHEPGQCVLQMWVKGVDPTTGEVPDGSTDVDEFYKRIDELTRLFYSETLLLEHLRPDGTRRQCVAELELDPLAFTRDVSSPTFGKFSVAMTIPSSFWTDTVDTSQTLTGTTGSTLTWTNFQGGTAPMDELIVEFGPGSNPEMVQESTGVLLAYDAVIAAGRRLRIDCSTWAVNGIVDGGGNWSYNYAALRHERSTRWFELTPNTDGTAPTTVINHTGGGSMAVTLSGKRKYYTG